MQSVTAALIGISHCCLTCATTGVTSCCWSIEYIWLHSTTANSVLSTLQNAAVCAPSIAIVFGLYPSDVVTLGQALINACTEECGEIYAGFLEDVCHDRFSTDSLKIACTPTGGSAAVGEFCRFALTDSIDISNINALQSCYDYTTEVPCPEDCRSAIHFLKIQIGCCYQHIYNNTDYFDHLQFLYWIFYPR